MRKLYRSFDDFKKDFFPISYLKDLERKIDNIDGQGGYMGRLCMERVGIKLEKNREPTKKEDYDIKVKVATEILSEHEIKPLNTLE